MAERLILPDLDLSSTDLMFLDELGATSERLLNRHDKNPREFYPFDVLDDYADAVRNEGFAPGSVPLSEAVKVSLVVNLSTEEGLPYYTTTLDKAIPKDHPFKHWLHRWTREEKNHAPTIANLMYATKQFDMHEVKRICDAMIDNPDTPQFNSFIESLVYPAFQEPATEVSHRNTMRLLPAAHRIGKNALAQVVGDEVKHGFFYRDMSAAALKINPSFTIVAIAKQVHKFAMPGKSIPGFSTYKDIIEDADIFGAKQLKEIYDKLITNTWNIWAIPNLTAEGDQARDWLAQYLTKMGRIIEKRAEKRARLAIA